MYKKCSVYVNKKRDNTAVKSGFVHTDKKRCYQFLPVVEDAYRFYAKKTTYCRKRV